MREQYDNFCLINIRANAPEDWDVNGADAIRVEMPANPEYELEMYRRGFYLADRTIGTSIGLSKLPENIAQMVRLDVTETIEYKSEIYEIAQRAFVSDRRFHVFPKLNPDVAASVLKQWVDSLDDILVCIYRERVIGFLALTHPSPDTMFVHLAAVEARYRLAGAASSLYARACAIARDRGCKKLDGRISSTNMPVMNIYAKFGAVFSTPLDIFLKEAV